MFGRNSKTNKNTTAQQAQQAGTTHTLETVGQVCPFPLVEAKQAMEQLPTGDQLLINFDCTQATDALPQWAAENGYPVTHFDRTGDAGWTITVQKA